MCGRYTVLTEDEIIEVRSIIREISLKLVRDELEGNEETGTLMEVAPTNRSPVVTSDGSALSFEHAKFGFERWDGKCVIINARSETVKEKSMFKSRVQAGRCVVPAAGYYEWKAVEGQKKKDKHIIKDKRGNLLFMAGLYRDGKDGREFVIITKNPVGDVVEIHDRMPVILVVNQLESWLSGEMPIDALASLDYDCYGESCEAPVSGNDGMEQLSLF